MNASVIIGICLCIWSAILCVLIVVYNHQDKKVREAREAEDEKIRKILLERLEEKQKKN